MSKMVVFLIKDKINYEKSLLISKKIILYCLKNDLGSIFNFLGYSENLIIEANPTLYFSISDDFLQLNSEYLNTEKIECIEEEKGKREIYKNFSFLDEIYNILIDFKLGDISLILSSDGSTEKMSDFKSINSDSRKIVEIIYNSIIESKDKYAYDIPNIIINFK